MRIEVLFPTLHFSSQQYGLSDPQHFCFVCCSYLVIDRAYLCTHELLLVVLREPKGMLVIEFKLALCKTNALSTVPLLPSSFEPKHWILVQNLLYELGSFPEISKIIFKQYNFIQYLKMYMAYLPKKTNIL